MPAVEKIRELYPDPPSAAPEARERARLELAARIERRRRRRALLPAVGLAVAAGAAAFALIGVGDEAGIDARAAAVLRQAAERTRAQPPIPSGTALYTKSVNAWMTTWADVGNFSVLVPQVREAWIEQDRTIIRVTPGEPKFLSERDRQRWVAAGRPELREGGPRTFVVENPGTSDLPSNPDALYAAIEDEARGHSEGTHRQMFTRVGDYLREASESAILTLEQRAALYEVAARIPGIEFIGEVRDPVGRKGVAVAMEQRSDGVRHTLVIDPVSGMLLAEEEVTLAQNFYGYPAGTVVGYKTVAFAPGSAIASNARKPEWAKVP
jgi:hypothetical protein